MPKTRAQIATAISGQLPSNTAAVGTANIRSVLTDIATAAPNIADGDMAAAIAAASIAASQLTGVVPIANLATGTPTGSKFVRDDGTLAVPAGGGGGAAWGSITGTLSSQSDLNTALAAKAAASWLSAHIADTTNPHAVTKSQVGLGNVDNTADTSKPVSTAQQTALDAKVAGPASAADGNIPVFNGTTGKILRDSGAVALTGVASSAGAADSGKVPLLNGSGLLDSTFQGTTAIAKGGTAATTALAARVNLNVGDTALTDAATILTDASLGNVFKVTLGGNRTLGGPSNLQAGATYIWRIKQDATGSRTLAFNSAFKFSGGTSPTLSTAANALDVISGVSDGTSIFCSFMADLR